MSGYTVYKHTSPSGKVYIGITGRPVSRRWHGGNAYRNNAHFWAAIKKYGWENIRHDIVAKGLTKEEACAMEVRLIAEYQSTNPSRGYNRSHGGDKTTLGYEMGRETRAKISTTLKGKRKGIPHTEEHAAHIRQSLMGRRASDETREKLRRVLGGRFQTVSAREKQRANTPKGARHPKATPVKCLTTGELFPTIEAAAQRYNIHRTSISACCRGIQKTAHGTAWEYMKGE